jgi:hypothetical protein
MQGKLCKSQIINSLNLEQGGAQAFTWVGFYSCERNNFAKELLPRPLGIAKKLIF